MKKWIRNLGMGSMIVAIAFTASSGASHANEQEDEMAHVTEAFEKMDEPSQEQFLSSLGGSSSMSLIDMSSMDLETALMMVQSKRAEILESQLKDQIAEVQRRNDYVAKLNNALNIVQREFEAFQTGKEITDKKTFDLFRLYCIDSSFQDALIGNAELNEPLKDVVDKNAKELESLNEEALQQGINQLRALIDNASNNQQMDMLRLQDLSNKRNEAFEMMTSFIKKMQDSRAAIIGNMR